LVGKLSASRAFGRNADRIVAEAELAALSAERPVQIRRVAVRLLGRRPSPGVSSLTRLLLPENPAEVQSAAVNALSDADDPVAAGFALAGWERYTTSTRHQLAAAALRSGALANALLTALERGKILLIEVDPSTRQGLQKARNAELRARAAALFQSAASRDREQVVQSFRTAVQLAGDRKAGAAIFARACLQCHALQGEGARVGPDLSGIATHSRETLLVDILDPSRQVLPDFASYTVVPVDGETLSGLITAETASSITVRRPNAPDVTIPRSQIKELNADGKSLMPEGLEQGLTMQDMADLLSFLRQPEAALLPKEK
jgi:putative heme-binding domain-containing protein